MAHQVSARLCGDDYQHLYSWWHALALLDPRSEVTEVWIEDDRAGSFDDVTVHYAAQSKRAAQFFQVKYHVTQQGSYSTDTLLDRAKGSSLLQKFWRTWTKLGRANLAPELTLFSNWSWDSDDQVGRCIDGHDGSLKEEFLTESARSRVGQLRVRWQGECGASDNEFGAFVRCLRLHLGSTNATESISRLAAERMRHRGLRDDESALCVAVGIVRGWIKAGVQHITRGLLELALIEHRLQDTPAEPSVTVYLQTIRTHRFDLRPDYLLDWREHFEGPEYQRSHRIVDPALWNGRMLPELQALEQRINQEQAPKLIRARGLARLSTWFALGHVFSRVAGYQIEVEQNGLLWRTDAPPSGDFSMVATRTPDGSARTSTLAVGISVTGSLHSDLTNYLQSSGFQGGVLELEPGLGPSRDVFKSAGDVTAFVTASKNHMRHWVDVTGAREVWMFYFGPLSGACFLGHDTNALGASLTIMEDQAPGYAPAFRWV